MSKKVSAIVLFLFLVTPVRAEIPPEIAGDPDQVYDFLKNLEASGDLYDYNSELLNLEELDPDVVEEVKRRLKADDEAALREANEDLRREQIEEEQFRANLKTMAGDEWAAYTAAFFQSTLFEPDKPMPQAFGENLVSLASATDRTTTEVVDEMNAEVAAEQEAKLHAYGDQVLEGYDQLVGDVVIDAGFEGYAHSSAVNRSALIIQSGFVGNILQIRYQINLLKIGTGEVPEGSFVTMPGSEVFSQVQGTLHEIGTAQANGTEGDATEAQIQQLNDFLSLPGMAPTPEHLAGREAFIDVLTDLSGNVADNYATYQQLDQKLRIKIVERNNLLPPRSQSEISEFTAKRDALDAEIAGLRDQLAELSPEASEQQYYLALNQSPFLSAPIEVEGFEGPMWQYLSGSVSGWRPTGDTSYRTPEKDQQALDQAIDFLDTTTMSVLMDYGTLVTSEDLIRATGSKELDGLRTQLSIELSPMIPNIGIYLDEVEGLVDREWAETEHSRMLVDVGTGLTGVVIGGVIILFPVTAPVLVPVELTLIGGDLVIQGGRLITAAGDYSRAETVAQSGAGDFRALSSYDDMLNAQTRTFVLTTALAPLGVYGSLSALDDAARLTNQTQRAGQTAAGAGEAAATGVATEVAVATKPTVVDEAAFLAMTPEQQAAVLIDIPEAVQARLISQLSPEDLQAVKAAKEWQVVVNGIREDPGVVQITLRGNQYEPMTADLLAQMTDEELIAGLKSERIILDKGRKASFLATEVGEDYVPLAQKFEAWTEATDLPPPGHYSSDIRTQADVDDLFRVDMDALLAEERQAMLLKKADVIRRGMKPSFELVDEETSRALVVSMVSHMQRMQGRRLTLEELDRVGWNFDWGAPPAYVPRTSVPPGAGSAMGSGSTQITGEATVIGAPKGMENAPRQAGLAGWNEVETPPLVSMDEILGNKLFFKDLQPAAGYPQSFLPSIYVDALAATGPNRINPLYRILGGAEKATGARVLSGAEQALSEGSVIVHLKPGPWALPEGKSGIWQNFIYRTFIVGGCQESATGDCGPVTQLAVLVFPSGKEQEVAASLDADPQVAGVDPNAWRWRLGAVNDPLFESRGSWGQAYEDQWGLHKIGLSTDQPGWPPDGSPQDEVVVAVIDTGLAWAHPDLGVESLWINRGEQPGNGIDDDGNGYVDDVYGWNVLDHTPLPWDLDGHGTLVASIIAARTGNATGVAGINPAVRIMALKALSNAGGSRASFIAEAIVYAANNGARLINLSVGGDRLTRAEQLAINYARYRGALVIAAAGNEGVELDDYGPGGAANVLTVAATGPDDKRLPWSNWGSRVDIAAPGLDIVGARALATDLMRTADPGDYQPRANFVGQDSAYYRATGTSFAAPIVTGVASLLLSAEPTLSAEQLERMLLQSAVDVETPGRDNYTGYGRVDAAAALRADPEVFVDASISGVRMANGDGGPVLQVLGTATGSEFRRAWLELGAGDDPAKWEKLDGGPEAPVEDGILGLIPARKLAGAKTWTIRLVAERAQGMRREARFVLNIQ